LSSSHSQNVKSNVVFNLPNTISWIRILSTAIIVILMYLDYYLAAFLLFTLAAISDYVDGYFARKYRLVTKLGKVLDQMSDKILITSIFVVFVEIHMIPGWLLIILIFRDTLVSVVRMVASDAGNIIAANIFGKMKTVSQMVLTFGLFFEKMKVLVPFVQTLNNVLMYFVAVVTVLSGIIYIFKNLEYLNR